MNVAKMTQNGNTTKVDVDKITSVLAQMEPNSSILVEYGSKQFVGTVTKALAKHRYSERELGKKIPNVLVVLGIDEQ